MLVGDGAFEFQHHNHHHREKMIDFIQKRVPVFDISAVKDGAVDVELLLYVALWHPISREIPIQSAYSEQ
jgi:hypothetical protein